VLRSRASQTLAVTYRGNLASPCIRRDEESAIALDRDPIPYATSRSAVSSSTCSAAKRRQNLAQAAHELQQELAMLV